jgi:hypothetical protein
VEEKPALAMLDSAIFAESGSISQVMTFAFSFPATAVANQIAEYPPRVPTSRMREAWLILARR